MGSLIATHHFHNQGSCLREHINDWADGDDGSITDVTSSLEADFGDSFSHTLHTSPWTSCYVCYGCMHGNSSLFSLTSTITRCTSGRRLLERRGFHNNTILVSTIFTWCSLRLFWKNIGHQNVDLSHIQKVLIMKFSNCSFD